MSDTYSDDFATESDTDSIPEELCAESFCTNTLAQFQHQLGRWQQESKEYFGTPRGQNADTLCAYAAQIGLVADGPTELVQTVVRPAETVLIVAGACVLKTIGKLGAARQPWTHKNTVLLLEPLSQETMTTLLNQVVELCTALFPAAKATGVQEMAEFHSRGLSVENTLALVHWQLAMTKLHKDTPRRLRNVSVQTTRSSFAIHKVHAPLSVAEVILAETANDKSFITHIRWNGRVHAAVQGIASRHFLLKNTIVNLRTPKMDGSNATGV